jgi:hypothetical protein
MKNLYASSSDNIYLGGHSDSRAQIWRYNGIQWNYIDYVDQLGPYNVIGITGFSEISIWVYGFLGYSLNGGVLRKNCVIQYNGSIWKLHNLDGYGRIIRLGGSSENNIWAVGDSGIIFNYNGSTWKRDYVRVNVPKGSSYFLNGVVLINNIAYLTAYIYDAPRKRYIHYFIKGNIGSWTIIDSMYVENPSSNVKFGNRGLYLSKEGELFSYGDLGVWKYNGSQWNHEINLPYSFISVYSYKKNYSLAVGEFGNVFFYNGSNWTKLERFFKPDEGLHINDAWTDGKEILLLANKTDQWPMKTIVFRGK